MTEGKAPINGFVQVCPNDGPPFLDLCRVYARAAESIGLHATTVFLGPSRVAPAPAEGRYLNATGLRDTRNLRQALRQRLPDSGNSLVLCHRYRAYWLFARSGLPAARVVALAHEHGFFKRRGRRLGRRLFGKQVSFAGVLPTIVEELQRTAGSALHLPNAVDLETLAWADREAARRQLRLPNQGICIGMVGRLHYKKNPGLAVDAFRLFNGRYGPAHLGIVGDGPLRAPLQRQADELPVTFAGFVQEPKRLFKAFDAVLLTSGARAFPIMVALEAMAAGVPVVAPRLVDAVSVLGKVGCYFDEPDPESIVAALRVATASGAHQAGSERVRSEFCMAAVAQRLQHLLD